MTRSELVKLLASRYPDLDRECMPRIVNAIIGEISGALHRGERVELRGFGAFSVKVRDGYMGRNPRNGENIEVPSKSVLGFRAGKRMHDRLNKTP